MMYHIFNLCKLNTCSCLSSSQGFFQPFWEGVIGPFVLGNFRYFNQNWENFFNL